MDLVNLTLDKFIQESSLRRWRNRAHLAEPGFITLYVRATHRYINGRLHENVLDIASVEARIRGKGAFKNLIARIRRDYPHLSIYIESVVEPRLSGYLKRAGFERVNPGAHYDISPCFFLQAEEPPAPCAA
jgi:hypothetical protein